MGVNQITHVFIGRLCSNEEKKRCFEQLPFLVEDEMCDVFNVEDACHFESDDELPIVPFTYGWGYDTDVLTRPMEEFTWFVVAKYANFGLCSDLKRCLGTLRLFNRRKTRSSTFQV
jgi:hypothetical protein